MSDDADDGKRSMNEEHYTRTMASNTSSSTEDDDWRSTPATPSFMTTATDEADADADAHASTKSQDATTPTATATSTAAIPHMDIAAADSIASASAAVGSGEQDQKLRDGQDQRGKANAQRGARPGSDSDNAQGPQDGQGPGSSSVTPSSTADSASIDDGSSARDRSPSPSIAPPPPARRQSQHYYFTSPHTRVGSISSVHSSSSSHNPNSTFQLPPSTPGRRNGRHVRPISLASVMSGGGQGPMSPVSGAASPRSSGYYHQYQQSYSGGGGGSSSSTYNILNRPLPQTPTASVGGSRPASLQFFASPTAGLPSASAYGAHWEPQVAANLRQQHSVPRPLRLQPSLMRRDTISSTTTADAYSPVAAAAAAAASAREETVLLRAHQAASRMARRRQWEQRLSPNEYSLQRSRLESNEGAFEVVNCFLQRLARAENDALLPENFPRSAAQQQQQKESMEMMRKETVEALMPLLAYGPSDPTPVKSVPKPTSFPAAASSANGKPVGPAPPSKAYAPRSGASGLPPTPPLSPYRHDPRRESGMSGITETSLNGGNDDASTTVWNSVKRASVLFGWGAGSSNSSMPSPAQSTRFTGE
ncbi:hypothetical protein F503_01998 [Ophiostoma piceae UAMH 11346]|uniref:Uncharacterized protein n=1 Tax=Ophiostoma piceae (strain UAMH 11346) TaxID=1262450 RepID=S3CRI9_OPHP1|nr:hypothetical protein F503_01998 [Ophiostoma piceae UAMH 11346]